jgi:alpha-methylacyl-CoA racemase
MKEWTALFDAADCCVSPVLRTDEAIAHPLFRDRGAVASAYHATEGSYFAAGPTPRFSD